MVLDRLGARRPGPRARRRREVRAHARAHLHRLADVEHLAARVAHHVDPRRVRHAGDVRHPATGAARKAAAVGRAGPAPPRALRAEQGARVADGRRVRAQLREQRAEDARARLGVGERAVGDLDLDPERLRQRLELALARQRVQPPRERDGADRRRVGPREPGALEGLRQDAAVERGAVRHQHATAQQLGQLGQARLRRRRLVDHRLRDPGEALDLARERALDAHERLPALVQLAAADQDGGGLGQLAGLAAEPVGLGVDDEELGAAQWCGVMHHRDGLRRVPDVMQALVRQFVRPPLVRRRATADERGMVRIPDEGGTS